MTIASEITKLNTNLTNAYTAVDGKGGTLPQAQNFDNLATAISSIPSGGTPTLITKSITVNGTYNASSDNADGYSSVTVNVSGGGSGTTDVPLTRISDDNGNEIGTWYMNFEDANGNMFKVILLDAQYRNASTQWCSNASAASAAVTNMPAYANLYARNVWEAKETATQNTQLILDYCSAGGYTSTSCSHCRSQSFTVGGVTYYGQLPNMIEVIHLGKHYSEFDQFDISASSYQSTNFSSGRTIWSSSQYGSSYGWCLSKFGAVSSSNKQSNSFTCPVLEIPNN